VESRLEKLQARRRGNAKVNSGGYSDAESHQDIQFCETKATGLREPQVREARTRVEEQVAQEESGNPPDLDSTTSPDPTATTGEDRALGAATIKGKEINNIAI
jgi:hypothetical protein